MRLLHRSALPPGLPLQLPQQRPQVAEHQRGEREAVTGGDHGALPIANREDLARRTADVELEPALPVGVGCLPERRGGVGPVTTVAGRQLGSARVEDGGGRGLRAGAVIPTVGPRRAGAAAR